MKKICFLPDGCSSKVPEIRRIICSAKGSYELTRDPTKADVIVQSVCAFTISKGRCNRITENLLYLKSVKKAGAIAIVYGCGAEVFDKRIYRIAGVDYIVREKTFEQITDILGVEPVDEAYYMKNALELVINLVPGCSKPGGYCFFCKQNYMKKKPYSAYSIEEVVRMVKEYGMPILYLTGMNNCNYGCDFGDGKPKLHILLHELEKISSLKYIDIDGIAPSCVYPELLNELNRNKKVYSVQFMLQSGSDFMLEKMNIGASVSDLENALEHLQGKRIITGVVVGHPWETLEDVKKTIAFLEKWNVWNCRVQPWEDSLHTPSHEMEPLPKESYQKHVDLMKEAVNKLAVTFLNNQIGKKIRGYVTDVNPKYNFPIWCSSTEFEAAFCLKESSRKLKPGDYIEAIVTGVICSEAQKAVLAAKEVSNE